MGGAAAPPRAAGGAGVSPRELGVLALAAAVMAALAAAALHLHHRPAADGRGEPWLAGLDVNAVTRVDLYGAGRTLQVSLERRPEGWGVAQRQHYPAAVGRLRTLLLDLAAARRLERKTDDPAQHAQLGLGDIGAADAGGRLLELAAGDRVWRLRLGAPAGGRSGTYARLADQDQCWLIDRAFSLDAAPRRWLEPALLDIGMERVRGFRITHPDGEAVAGRRSRDAAAPRYAPQGMPAGRALQGAHALDRAAAAIAGLALEDVMPASRALAHLQRAARIRYELDAGFALEARLFALGAERYARFAVAAGDGLEPAARREAAALARRFRGWAFRVPAFAYDSMALRWADVLAPAGGGE